MSFLGIGPIELVFLVILLVLIFGPEDLVSAGKKLGRFLNQVKRSDFWSALSDLRKRAKTAGEEIIKETGIDEVQEDLELMPDLNDFRRELDQLGFKPNFPESSDKEKVSY